MGTAALNLFVVKVIIKTFEKGIITQVTSQHMQYSTSLIVEHQTCLLYQNDQTKSNHDIPDKAD